MKKCLKCGTEYQDDDVFCPICGERLTTTNACQRCGRPVSVEETYCRHCGYKIEKEIKCPECGASLNPDAKFCQECGAKVENPVVTVKQKASTSRPASSGAKAAAACGNSRMNPVLQKVFYYAFGGVLLFLLSLMFIGCFGDIMKARVNGSSLASTLGIQDSVGVSYFFGDAMKSIKQAGELEYKELQLTLIIQFMVEVFIWLATMALFIMGIVVGIINLVRGEKNEYRLKTKPYVFALLAALPYLAIFALESRIQASVKQSGGSDRISYGVEMAFGWGTQMIATCAIIGVFMIVGYNILTAIFERKNIVQNAVRGGLAFALITTFVATMGLVISVYSKQVDTYYYSSSSTTTITTGSAPTYLMYIMEVSSYSTGSIEKMPAWSIQCLVSFIITLFGYGFVHAAISNLLNGKRNFAPILVNGILAIVVIIAGAAVGLAGVKGSMGIDGSTTDPDLTYKLSIGGGTIALIVFLVLAIAGYIVASCMEKEPEEQPQVQQ